MTFPSIDFEDQDTRPALVFARRDIRHKHLERPHLWYASMRNMPEGWKLPQGLARPFMNFKECNEALMSYLQTERRPSYMAFRGQRTWYPKNETLLLKVIVPENQKEPDHMVEVVTS